mgnify:CR=1 FL=1
MEHAVMYGLLILEVEAMDGHGIGLALQPVLSVCEPPHIGEQVGIPAGPVFGISLPEVLGTVLADAVQHRAAAIQNDGETVVGNGGQIHCGFLPMQYFTVSIHWNAGICKEKNKS